MLSLFLTLFVVILVYMLRSTPFVAGLVAVIPVKILAASIFTYQTSSLKGFIEAVQGMLVGQFFWGFVLLAVYLVLR